MRTIILIAALALTACATEVESYETPSDASAAPDAPESPDASAAPDAPALDCDASEVLASACASPAAEAFHYVTGYPGAKACPSHAPECDRHWVTTPNGQALAWCCP